MKLHKIRSVFPMKNYRLILEFDDGEYRWINVLPLMLGPVFEPLKDFRQFQKVHVDEITGTITWPNEVDLDPNVLYESSTPLNLSEAN